MIRVLVLFGVYWKGSSFCFLQDEVFPYPEIGNEELEEIKQLVAPVERFFSEEGVVGHSVHRVDSVTTTTSALIIPSRFSQN